jgi:hypothetical protein
MQGPRKILTAALYRHPAATELRVYLEPEALTICSTAR